MNRAPRPGPFAALLLLLAPLWVLAARQALADLVPCSPTPDALLAAAVVAAWCAPPGRAALFAAVTGCLADVASDLPFGLLGARLALLTGVFAALGRGLEAGLAGRVLAVFGFALLERTLAALALAAFAPDAVALGPLLPRAGWTALATAPLAPLAFAVGRALLPEAPRRGS